MELLVDGAPTYEKLRGCRPKTKSEVKHWSNSCSSYLERNLTLSEFIQDWTL